MFRAFCAGRLHCRFSNVSRVKIDDAISDAIVELIESNGGPYESALHFANAVVATATFNLLDEYRSAEYRHRSGADVGSIPLPTGPVLGNTPSVEGQESLDEAHVFILEQIQNEMESQFWNALVVSRSVRWDRWYPAHLLDINLSATPPRTLSAFNARLNRARVLLRSAIENSSLDNNVIE